MDNIQDYHRYIQLMRYGYYDKLFFVDKLFRKWTTFLDYGCAEGFQTKLIAQTFPDKVFIGYDTDISMLNLAQYSGSWPGNVRFTNKKEHVPDADVIFLSSVIHEVYSYAKNDSIREFWGLVFSPKRKYVIIRDMMPQDAPLNSVRTNTELINAITRYCNDNNMFGEMKRFEESFLPLTTTNHVPILHFLLKLPYINSPNWSREINENYLPLSKKNIEFIAPDGWELEYSEEYTLPYLRHWWRENLGIIVPYTTHGKLIFYNTNIKQ